jgi:mono/diheme cytochrome c family protein
LTVAIIGWGAAVSAEETKATDAAAAAEGSAKTLAEAVKAEKGTLKNPFTDNAEAIAEGKKLYLSYSCNGCHGGGGGGGMCPPLTNERFVYGSDDDTIFRLISMGSDELQAAGYKRVQKETVTGPMPPYMDIIESEEELWKVIAYIRSVYKGRAEKRDW